MSLSFTQKLRGKIGGRVFRCYDVTCDDSTTTILASDIGLHGMDTIMLTVDTLTSALAAPISIANSVGYAVLSEAPKTDSILTIWAIGS